MTNQEIIANVATVCPTTQEFCRIASVGNGWKCMDCEREMTYARRRDLIAAIRYLIGAPE